MCGIICHVSAHSHAELDDSDVRLLSQRGPDSLNSLKIIVTAACHKWYLTFSSSVLSLRGTTVTQQPLNYSESGSVLCWNGEVWQLDGHEVAGNDTMLIADHLFSASRTRPVDEDAVAKVMSGIQGPFAFVYFDGISNKLYFGRDALGRRSLLMSSKSNNASELTISSVLTTNSVVDIREAPTSCLHVVDLNKPELMVKSVTPNHVNDQINRDRPSPNLAIATTPTSSAIKSLLDYLSKAVRLRVQAIPTYTAQQNKDDFSRPARVAVLFSGGLDCTLVARICHDILPLDEPIDLLNVAFENPRVVSARAKESNTPIENSLYEACPDRITGRSSLSELARVCSERIWRFVAINVPYHDFQEHRSTIIHLMHPHNTEMDLSITAALYFAARGQGHMDEQENNVTEYTTTARVLLCGLGADELFGGYARHAAAFTRGGYEALNDELELDFKRIGTRNLGRDDRVIAHWGRETRYPFLDENFVEFALSLPAWEKCGFRAGKVVPKHFEQPLPAISMEDLHPEKMLLRCALWQLGMPGAAAEKKRAIQFGARTAKMIGGKTKGTDVVT